MATDIKRPVSANLRPAAPADLMFRRRQVRKYFSLGYTPGQILDHVNADLLRDGIQTVSRETIRADIKLIRADFNEVYEDEGANNARDNLARLAALEQRQNEDYERARADDRPVAALSDNIRKTIKTRAEIDGSIAAQKHEISGNVTFEHRVKELLAIQPASTEVLELLDDEYAVTPTPRIAADA